MPPLTSHVATAGTSCDHWQKICDSLSTALMVVAPEGQITHINCVARRFVGLTPNEACPRVEQLPFCRGGSAAGVGLQRLIAQALAGEVSMTERALPLAGDKLAYAPQPMEMCVTVGPIGGVDEGGGSSGSNRDPPCIGELVVQWRVQPARPCSDAHGLRLQQLEAVVNNAAAVIFIKDLSHRYILANQAFLGLFKLSSAVGMTDDHLFPPAVAEALRANDREVIARRQPFRCEEVVPLKDEERTYLALKFPLFDTQGVLVAICGIATNITDSKRAEQENKRLLVHAQAAEEASKLKSNFLATMSHEIRTPLAGIIGLCGLLNQSHQSPEQTELTGQVHRAASDLLVILNDILDFSKLEAGKFDFEQKPLQVADLVASLSHILGPVAAAKELGLEMDVGHDVPGWLVGDATRLRQVLFNLVSNAIKFSQRGRVRVTFSVLSSERKEEGTTDGPEAWAPAAGPARCQPAALADDPQNDLCLVVEIEDDGVGIAEGDIKKLFSLFTQADASISRRFGGTGLGLAICRSIVEGQGGRIGVVSRLNEGARFWFRLPTRRAEVIQSPEVTRPTTGRCGQLVGRILVAEDNAVNQLVVVSMLKKMGLSCDLAVDGAEAVRRARNTHYDAILMDCHMPQVDGLEATREIRRMHAHHVTPIIALTANAMHGEKERCLEAGMSAHLVKPVDLDTLFSALSSALDDVPSSKLSCPSL